MGVPRQQEDHEPCCDGESLKIPCCPPIPPFRFHYFLVLIAIACVVFCYIGPEIPTVSTGDGGVSPALHQNSIYLAMTIFAIMITCTILHEGGHAFATLCAPKGRVRHIMLNPCCGGHAFVGHAGGELWEAWVAFAGPIWDISTAMLFYFIMVCAYDHAYSSFLKDTLPMEVKELKLEKLVQDGCTVVQVDGKPQFKTHFLDDDEVFWRVALAILMDYQFVTFVFNMLPIVTLDGADFFGSFFRLCTNPIATGIFLICTSLICILGLIIWQGILPAINIYDRWDDITAEPKWADDDVKMFLFSAVFILMKMMGFLGPTFRLICDTCSGNKGLKKYHVFQVPKYEEQQRAAAIPMYEGRENQRYSNPDRYSVVNL
jgi:hypothetical protein